MKLRILDSNTHTVRKRGGAPGRGGVSSHDGRSTAYLFVHSAAFFIA